MAEVKYRITGRDDSKQAVTSATQGMNKIKKSSGDLKIAFVAAAAAMYGLVKASTALIGKYSKQLDAETKLANAIKATGKQTEISMAAMKKLATRMQDTTRVGDETTLSVLATTQALADLDQKGLERVLPGLLDFGAYLGNADTAANLIGKTLGSSTNALARYGIEIDMTGTKAEKLAELTEQLQNKFGGLAEEMGSISIGAMDRFKNNMGDVFENLGGLVAESMKGPLDAINDWFSKNRQNIANTIKALPEIIAAVGKYLPGILRENLVGGNFQKVVADMVSILVTGFKVAVSTFSTLLGAAIASLPQLFTATMTSIGSIIEMGLTKALDPAILEEKMSRIEFGRYMAGKGQRLSGNELTKQYEDYLKQFEKHNEFMMKMNKATTDSMSKVMKNADAALGNIGETLRNAFKETGNLLGDLKDDLGDLGNNEKTKELIDTIDQIIGKYEELETQAGQTLNTVNEGVAPAGGPVAGPSAPVLMGPESVGPFYEVIQSLTEGFSAIFQNVMSTVSAFSAINTILNPIQSVLSAFYTTIEPMVTKILKPLTGALRVLGETLGAVIIPILQIFAPILNALAKGFMWLYNKAIMPVANFFIRLIGTIGNFFIGAMNAILTALNKIPFVHFDLLETIDIQENLLQPINMESLVGTQEVGETGGNAAQYTPVRDINATINIYVDVIAGDDGLRDLAIMIRNELHQLEELGV